MDRGHRLALIPAALDAAGQAHQARFQDQALESTGYLAGLVDGKRALSIGYRGELDPAGRDVLHVIWAAGDPVGPRLAPATLELLEQLGRGAGFERIRFETWRPGLVRTARARAYTVTGDRPAELSKDL